MMNKPPEQVPSDSYPGFDDFREHKLEDKTSSFSYSDSTQDHIGGGETQQFSYGGDGLPEKS